jgi:hypothetical protein
MARFRIPHSVIRSIVIAALLIVIAGVPNSVHAADASVDAILGAVAELRKQGSCFDTKKPFGDDCIRTETSCIVPQGMSANWEVYWRNRYEMFGGTVVAKQGVTDPLGLEWLRADWGTNSKAGPPTVYAGTCYCQCPANATFAPCSGNPEGTPFRVAEDLVYEQCAAKCTPYLIADKCAGKLPPLSSKSTSAAAAIAQGASYTDDTTCFTPEECTKQEGIFEAYDKCKNGKGRCFAQEPEVKLNTSIGNVTRIQGFANYVAVVYRYMISIVAVAATVMFTFGAFLYLLGSAIPKIEKGKTYMIDSVVGLLLVLGANFILRTLNPATLNLNPIKVYMVNALSTANQAYCSDLGAVKMALAGTRQALKSYEEVSKDPKNFSILAEKTECGKLYWAERSVGSACEGSMCPTRQACRSCADGLAPGCMGFASDKRICSEGIFFGGIRFSDGKYPTGVDLLMFCNQAMSTNADKVKEAISAFVSQKPFRVGATAGAVTTDSDKTGSAGYNFTFNASDLAIALDACKSKGGFRGALLGLVYKESLSSIALAVDDVAVLSKANCGKGAAIFDGYANGGARDVRDEAEAIACGIAKGKFTDSDANFWRAKDLWDAVNGKQPITCDFTLTALNAPEDPRDKMCGAGVAGPGDNPNCKDGADCAAPSAQCQSAVETCTCLENKTLGNCKIRAR